MTAILAIIGPLVGAVVKLGDFLVNPIKKQVSYLCCYNSNAQTLIQEDKKLDIAIQTVQQQVDAAQRNLEDIRPDVADWLKRANETKTTSGEVLTNADNYIQKACLSKWHPCLHYCSSREAKKTTDAFVGLQNNGKYDRVSVPANPANLPPIPATSAIGFKSRHPIEREIMDALKDDSVYLIGLCGMGGVGKTTMAEKIMSEAKTKLSMFEVVVWATVSQPQDLKKVQQKIAEGIGLNLYEENEQIRAAKLHERLKSLKSFLIILDDVWKKLDITKDLGIPFQSITEKRKLILTSRVHDVLILTNDPKILTIGVLTEDEAWSLFQEKAGQLVDAVQETAKEVAKECKGLPLALVVVGSALRGKNEHSWKDALRQLQRSSVPATICTILQEVYLPLRWSYDQLQNEEAQNIFLLCCLFPEDYEIHVEILVRHGWGLRLFRGTENLSEARDRVHGLLEMLKLRFLLIDAEEDDCVKMHDVIRDMAISIASKDGHGFLVNDDRKEWPSKESYADYTHISVNLGGNFTLPDCIVCPRLEFLKMEFDYGRKVEMPDNLYNSTIGLRVLEVNKCASLPSSMFGLTNLQVLHLEHSSLEMTSLVGKLENLEILNLRFSHFRELPKEVGQLKELKILDLTSCRGLKENIAAGVISGLVKLEELLMKNSFNDWEAEEDGKERKKASLAEVASLTKLVNLEIDIKNPKLVSLETQKLERYYLRIGNTFFCQPKYKKVVFLRSYEEKSHLHRSMSRNAEYLRLEGNGCFEIINDMFAVQYPKVLNTNLKYLRLESIKNITRIFSCQISKGNFSKLQVLEVKWCHNLRNILVSPMFQGLTSLTSLKLSECEELEEVIAQEEAQERPKNEEENLIPHLKELELKSLPKLWRFCHMTNTLKLPSLERMIIENCPILESFSMRSNDSDAKSLFNKEVLNTNLKYLRLENINNITEIFSCQISKRNFSKLEALKVKSCDSLRNILASPMFRSLTSLTSLKLSKCEELEEVIAREEAQERPKNEDETLFPHLKSLKLESLPKLRRFCHMTNALKLPSLEVMIITDCPMLDSFSMGSNDSEAKFLFNKEVLCPNLKKLWVYGVNCTGFFDWGTLKGDFSGLEDLDVQACPKLKNLLAPPMFRGLKNLKRLKLVNCEELQEVIVPNEAQEENMKETLFPQLKELVLIHLPKMRRFCHMTNDLELPSLETMEISYCSMLESFSMGYLNSDTKFLFNKEVLCTNLYRLELEDVNGATGLFENRISIDNFSGLGILHVGSCYSLKNLFSPPTSRGLINLKELRLQDCKELEEVIAFVSQEGQRKIKEILFPKLEVLMLKKLPKFHRFCHIIEDLELPSLHIITIDDCPEMETFSLGSLYLPCLELVYGIEDPILATKFFFNKEKCSEEIHMDNSCFKLSARDLSLSRGSRDWDMCLIPDSSYSFLHVAKLHRGNVWVEVNGRCPTANLSSAGAYEIFYVIMLKEPIEGWKDPVNFRLTLPEGITQHRAENLRHKPRGQWLEILAGEFTVEPNQIGYFEFSLYQKDYNWKWGLLIKSVIIRPKSK